MDTGSPIVPLTIAFFLAGMTLLGFVVIVVETWWVVAVVGIVHIVGSLILGILVVRQLSAEEEGDPDQDD